MHKYLISGSILALAASVVTLAAVQLNTAEAAGSGVAICYPTKTVLEVTGTDPVKYAGATTAFLRARISEDNRKNFMTIKNSAGAEIICTW